MKYPIDIQDFEMICKDYLLPFVTNGRELIKIGINFSKETRNIEKWEIKE